MTPWIQHYALGLLLFAVVYAVLSTGWFLGHTMWRLVRERNYCRELLRREQQLHSSKQHELLRSNIEQQNSLLRIVSTAYASGEPVTLDDLLTRAEQDFNLRSSRTPPDGSR